jgi:CheY-like chemotaxis protein
MTTDPFAGRQEATQQTVPMDRARVMVVDDEDLVRLVIARQLRFCGFDVVLARDGVEAMAMLPSAAPDLVLTDLNMPRCNGEQLCRELRALPSLAAIPVVLMTGGPIDEARLRRMGCAAVLYKPLPDTLPDVLWSVLKAPVSISA